MDCKHCAVPCAVLETRAAPDGLVRRRHACPTCNFRFNSYELTQEMYNYARFQVSRYRKIAGGEHKKKLREWAHTRRLMREDRLAGMKCADIAKKYGYTLHSTRAVTRIPRR